jgi:hypothetical protein
MVLECYFDGANQPDQAVLAMACGTPAEWASFNADWNDLLQHYPAPPLHTTDAVSLKRNFSADKGWDRENVNDFISNGVKLIGKHIARPIPSVEWQFISGLQMTTLTIPLDDYRRAREVVPLPNSINEILTSETLGFCFKWGTRIGAESFDLHFDQGEPFYGHALDRCNSEQAKTDARSLAKIANLSKDDSRLTPALQVADLLAWCISHNDNTTRQWHRVLNDLPWASLFLDYDYLVSPLKGALERTASWGLTPRRKIPAEPDPDLPE